MPRLVELDLIGRTITLSESDTRVLLAAAEAASGSSVGSRDLATRLKDLSYPASGRPRRLVFSRPELRAMQRTLQDEIPPGERLHELRLMLAELMPPAEPRA